MRLKLTELAIRQPLYLEQATLKLATSIRKKGQQFPVSVVYDEGRYHVVDGRRRIWALQHLGRKTVKVIIVSPINLMHVSIYRSKHAR